MITKQGQHGTLRLFTIAWNIPADPGFGEQASRVWAYDAEHAREKFIDSCLFQGFDEAEITAITYAKGSK